MHKSITAERIIEACEADDYLGFCVSCGHEQSGCEPDMRKGECESCGEHKVYGAEELAMHNLLKG